MSVSGRNCDDSAVDIPGYLIYDHSLQEVSSLQRNKCLGIITTGEGFEAPLPSLSRLRRCGEESIPPFAAPPLHVVAGNVVAGIVLGAVAWHRVGRLLVSDCGKTFLLCVQG